MSGSMCTFVWVLWKDTYIECPGVGVTGCCQPTDVGPGN